MTEEVFVHPNALVESDEVGEGTRVWAFAHVMKGAVVGRECKIGDHAFIESGATLGNRVTVKNGCLIWHGVHIGDEVFVGPNVVFTNDMTPRVRYQTRPEDWISTEVDRGASIGANATIVCGVRLGENCMIGAGSVVTRDVPAHALVFGNPARQRGWVCECGADLDDDLACPSCSRRYQETSAGLSSADAG
ncbi:MAG TPA: acyltransferase [Acidimicrobiia bacterium]|nr:acyltransferase [Acidimicrobiia bacterium]